MCIAVDEAKSPSLFQVSINKPELRLRLYVLSHGLDQSGNHFTNHVTVSKMDRKEEGKGTQASRAFGVASSSQSPLYDLES